MQGETTELESWLGAWVRGHGGVAGTVHARVGEALELRAALNIPPPVIAITRTIPIGKGMAGLAWQEDRAISTCNLKDDRTGAVRPGAKAVDAGAAVALPIHDAAGGVRGVVGIAFAGERDLGEEELADLARAAEQAPV